MLTYNKNSRGISKDVLDVLVFVFVSDCDVVSVFFEVVLLELAENIIVGREIYAKVKVVDTVVPDPRQRVVNLWICRFEVFQREFLIQHLLVKRQREATVDKLAVIQCLNTRSQMVLNRPIK